MAGQDNHFALQGSVWMTMGGESFGGKGRVGLLAMIAECGSITQAAKAYKMSYKAAWDAIDKMNNLAGEPLVERLVGGKGGGGTRLTERGRQLVANFAIIEREHQRFIAHLSGHAAGIADDLHLMSRMSMRTSARNQFLGKISRITRGAVNDEIELDIGNGQAVVATITHESTSSLGLSLGAEAFALIKASSVVLAAGEENARFSARNHVRGTVTRIQPGAVNTEVVLEGPGGQAIASIITNDSAVALELQVGSAATALFKASSVILAVPG